MSNNDQFEKLLNAASEHLGTDPEKLRSAAQSGDIEKALNNLKPEDAQKLQKVLSDKNAASKLLSTPQAQQLLKKLLGEK